MVLGRLDDAVKAYEEGMNISEKHENKRHIAAIKGQIGTVRMYQHKYEEALALFTEAKELFQQLGEYRSVAVIFYRQSCDIYIELEDLEKEGRTHNNLAHTLIKLKRFDQARKEIQRTIECDNHFGHGAEPWTAFNILYNLETATGNKAAAAEAWHKAFATYLSYRKGGGYGKSRSARVTGMFMEGKKGGNTVELKELLVKAKEADLAADDRLFFTKLESVLEGSRDLSLAKNTGLFFMDMLDFYLLVEGLQ